MAPQGPHWLYSGTLFGHFLINFGDFWVKHRLFFLKMENPTKTYIYIYIYVFVRVLTSKNRPKIVKKRRKRRENTRMATKSRLCSFCVCFYIPKMHFWSILGLPGGPLGHLVGPKRDSKIAPWPRGGPREAPGGPQEAFWLDFGTIWGQFLALFGVIFGLAWPQIATDSHR